MVNFRSGALKLEEPRILYWASKEGRTQRMVGHVKKTIETALSIFNGQDSENMTWK